MVSKQRHDITEGIQGHLDRYEGVAFGALHERNVDVWLPPGYDPEGPAYPVVFAQDGQNLFMPHEAFAGVDWGIDETTSQLVRQRLMRPAVVVGLWNSPKRLQEYMPEQPLRDARYRKLKQSFSNRFGGIPCSDAYLEQVVTTVLPFVEATYNVSNSASQRMLMGSSMGGLISLYGLCQYPDLFGAAACLSTSLTIIGEALHDYIDHCALDAARHRLYFDYGIEAETPAYEQAVGRLCKQLHGRGYTMGQSLDVFEVPGAPHSEAAWRDRLDRPLLFMLGSR